MEKMYTGKEVKEIAALYGFIKGDIAHLSVAHSPIPNERREEMANQLPSRVSRLRAMIDEEIQGELDINGLERQAEHYKRLYASNARIRELTRGTQ